MATQAQIEANRRNAQRSTGPRTDDGKAASRQNALRHGFCATSPLMGFESQKEMQELLALFREENQPVGANEEYLVFKMAEHVLYQKRASILLTTELDFVASGEGNPKMVPVYMRYHAEADRGFNRSLQELRKLQKQRRIEEIGFVSETAVEAPAETAAPPKAEPPAAPKPVAPAYPPAPAAAKPVEKPFAPGIRIEVPVKLPPRVA